MLYDVIVQSSEAGHAIIYWIEVAAMAIEIVAVVIIVASVFFGIIEYLYRRLRGIEVDPYRALKGRLGRSMLLGLEILVAADIVRTIALEATLESVGILGLLVLIRTFLSWSLDVELEGRWPWQARAGPKESVKRDEP